MNSQFFNNQQFIENTGWTLLHSLWQISLLALLLVLFLRTLKNTSANLRYLCCISALFLAFALPIATFLSIPANITTRQKQTPTPISETSSNNLRAKILDQIKTSNATVRTTAPEAPVEIKSSNFFEDPSNGSKAWLISLLPYFVWFWFLGVLFFSFRLCGGFWQTHRFKTNRALPAEQEWQKKFDNLCDITGIRRSVIFFQSEIVKTPLVTGWLKPVVIVPSSVFLGLTPRELETILAHELIHIRRHDYLVNILQSFVETALFFHPLIWWISSQARRERENACDDAVLKVFSGEPLLYANALANLEDFRFRSAELTPSNIVAASGGNLTARIRRIVEGNVEKRNTEGSFWAAIPFLLFATTFLSAVFLTNWQATISKTGFEADSKTKKVAVGLYQSPVIIASENTPQDDEETMRLIITKLKRHGIPTTGFLKGVNVNVYDENTLPEQRKTVNAWREAGFEIGLQDLKHPQSFDSTIDEYKTTMKKQSEAIDPYFKKQSYLYKEIKVSRDKGLKGIRKKQLEILNEIQEKIKSAVNEWMKENNLIAIRYTFGTHDWMYSYIYDAARKNNDKEVMNRIKAEYIAYITGALDHYEKDSQRIFGRDIPQTMPLIPTRLIADSADELFAIFEKQGYQFVSMDEALRDEAFESDSPFAIGTGTSWLEAAALKRKITPLSAPKVEDYILKMWEGNQPKN